uniref:Uncharacterized protein n=1 Tax=Daucus carota subsp. sativus TaxID=79200 RepID=A0A162A3D5_DAUCS
MSLLFGIREIGLLWCAEGDDKAPAGRIEGVHYDYAPAASEGDDDDDGGYDYAPAA